MDSGLKGKYAFVCAGAYGMCEAVADLLTQSFGETVRAACSCEFDSAVLPASPIAKFITGATLDIGGTLRGPIYLRGLI
jgi:hypothetical protein